MTGKIITKTYILKAYGGDRAKNLEGIADWIDETFPQSLYTETTGRFHELRGYAEQLRIIAEELREHLPPQHYLRKEEQRDE